MPKPEIKTFPLAVSLKNLAEILQSASSTPPTLPDSIYRLGGLFRFTGFIEDKENRDIILLGEGADSTYSLNLNDFNESLHSPLLGKEEPGCSLDPRPEDNLAFHQMGEALNAHPRKGSKIIKQWKEKQTYQDVRLIGLAHNSSIGNTIIEADYLLKDLAIGKYRLNIDGFQGIPDIMTEGLGKSKSKLKKAKFPALENRFWFVSGAKELTRTSVGGTFFSKAEITLLNEEMVMDSTGRSQGTGQVHPFSQKFIDGFNQHYREVSEYFPVFTRMKSIYNLVLFQKLMLLEGKYKEYGINPRIFANFPPLGNITVPDSLPSQMEVRTYRFKFTDGVNEEHYTLKFPFTGGVLVNPYLEEVKFSETQNPLYSHTTQRALKARPSKSAVFWTWAREGKI